jgi:hypothetical protein
LSFLRDDIYLKDESAIVRRVSIEQKVMDDSGFASFAIRWVLQILDLALIDFIGIDHGRRIFDWPTDTVGRAGR